MANLITVPASHQIYEAIHAVQKVLEKAATNQTTEIYEVPSLQGAFLTNFILSVKSTDVLAQLVKIAFYEDEPTTTTDFNFYVPPYDVITYKHTFNPPLMMAPYDKLSIISPDAQVIAQITAHLLVTAQVTPPE